MFWLEAWALGTRAWDRLDDIGVSCPQLGLGLLVLWAIFGSCVHKDQARKKSTKIDFWGPETARWGGGLPLEEVMAEKFVPSLESLSSLGVDGRNLGRPGILPGCPGSLGVFFLFRR